MDRLFVMTLGAALLLAGCAQKRVATTAADPGKSKFEVYCAGCHVNDEVTSGPAPTLAGSSWVTGPEGRIIRIVLHGVGGPIEVVGKTYDLTMPGFAPVLTDEEIASLATYVRSRFGGVSTPVSATTVAEIRATNQARREYWTVAELLASK